MRARTPSNRGYVSTKAASSGIFSFRELTSVKAEMKDIGTVQKRHNTTVAAKLNSRPVR